MKALSCCPMPAPVSLALSICDRCKLPTRAMPTSTHSHKELQLQQEQDTRSFYRNNLYFALLSPTPPYSHFLGYSWGFFLIFLWFSPLGEVFWVCLRWVYGCCPGQPITSATRSCQEQEQTMLPADSPLPPATVHQ